MQHQQIYFHTFFNLKCYLFALGASIYTCSHTKSHAAADQTLSASVCAGSASGDQRFLLLSRCMCTAGVPPHPPSSVMNHIINLSTSTSSSSGGVSSSCFFPLWIPDQQRWAHCFTHSWASVCVPSQW